MSLSAAINAPIIPIIKPRTTFVEKMNFAPSDREAIIDGFTLFWEIWSLGISILEIAIALKRKLSAFT